MQRFPTPRSGTVSICALCLGLILAAGCGPDLSVQGWSAGAVAPDEMLPVYTTWNLDCSGGGGGGGGHSAPAGHGFYGRPFGGGSGASSCTTDPIHISVACSLACDTSNLDGDPVPLDDVGAFFAVIPRETGRLVVDMEITNLASGAVAHRSLSKTIETPVALEYRCEGRLRDQPWLPCDQLRTATEATLTVWGVVDGRKVRVSPEVEVTGAPLFQAVWRDTDHYTERELSLRLDHVNFSPDTLRLRWRDLVLDPLYPTPWE